MFIFYSFRYQYVKQLFKNELSRKGGGGEGYSYVCKGSYYTEHHRSFQA